MRSTPSFLLGARRARIPFLLTLLAACAVALPSAAQPASSARADDGLPVIEAGREQEVLDLVRPYRLGAEVAGGFRLNDVQIRPRAVVFVLTTPGGAAASLELDPRDPSAVPAEATLSFALKRTAPDGDPAAASAVERLAAAVRVNDSRSFWNAAAEPPLWDRAAFSRETRTNQVALAVVWIELAGAFALLVALACTLARGIRGAWRPIVASAALFSAALAARWWLPVRALLHENRHGYLFDPTLPFNVGVAPHDVPSAHLTLYKIFHQIAPLGGESLFALGASLSAIAVVGAYWLGRLAFASPLAGWSVAALLALQPLQIVLGPTEEYLLTATGLCLSGMPLVWIGVERRLVLAVYAGSLLVGLGASARDITLPLAALGPLTALAVRPAARTSLWGLVHASIPAVITVVPRTLSILQALAARPGSKGLLHVPRLPIGRGLGLDPDWIGWQTPYIPRWMGWLIVVSAVAAAVQAIRTRNPALGLVAVGAPLLAQLQGGLATASWFPSVLRHQLFAAALWMLPCGWLIAWLGGRLPAFRGAVAAQHAAAPLLAAASLFATPASYHVDLPITQEFQFFDRAVRSLRPGARVVELPRERIGMDHVGRGWLKAIQPTWRTLPDNRLEDLKKPGAVTYFLLDRTCFLDDDCIGNAPGCGKDDARDAVRLRGTRYGRMHDHCERVLHAVPWREIARREIRRPSDPRYDLPSVDPVVTLAVLEWSMDADRAHAPPREPLNHEPRRVGAPP